MPNKNGLHLITPTSIASTGTGNSSSINTNGSVTFSTCATLSLNGVFSADYDNYMIVVRYQGSTGLDVRTRLRASGTDNSTASSYVAQYVEASSTTVAGARTTADYARLFSAYSTQRDGVVVSIYGPFLTQPTAMRSITAMGNLSAYIQDNVATHNQSVAYDGFSFIASTGSITGLVCVYGMRN